MNHMTAVLGFFGIGPANIFETESAKAEKGEFQSVNAKKEKRKEHFKERREKGLEICVP